MKTEDLKEKGLTEEQVQFVMAENGKDIQKEKDKVSKVELERDGYKEQLETTKEALKEFEGVDAKALGEKIETLNGQLKNQKEEYEKKISGMETEGRINDFFSKYKFTSKLAEKAAMEEFKGKGLPYENGEFLGGKDFMENLKKENPTAFEGEEDPKAPVLVKPTTQRKPGEKMTLADAMKFKNEHPDADISKLI